MKLADSEFQRLVDEVDGWVRDQWTRYSPEARTLYESERQAMMPFFPDLVLDRSRIAAARLHNPPFTARLRAKGLRNLPDLSSLTAMVFLDLIATQEELDLPTLFHELVHVAQYQLMGRRAFCEEYLREFFDTGAYEKLPVEVLARELAERFRRAPRRAFSVHDEVRKWWNQLEAARSARTRFKRRT